MKGLIFAFGLIPALFLSVADASIYDTASHQSPKMDTGKKYSCTYGNVIGTNPVDIQTCKSLGESESSKSLPFGFYYEGCSSEYRVEDDEYRHNCKAYKDYDGVVILQRTDTVSISKPLENSDTRSCPPDAYPLYTFDVDSNGDGKIDLCFNPQELDQLSNCAAAANGGKILPIGGNTSSKVCAVNEDGTSCGFSQVSAGNSTYYSVDLEMNCFGDADVPEYDPDAGLEQPQDEQCTPYGDGFACSADPSNTCDANGVCPDNCGYVNGQFICFRDVECAGAICENPPVTDPDNPDPTDPDPDNPDPTDPTDPCVGDNCTPTTGGGGGSSFVFDYDKMKSKIDESLKGLLDENEMDDGKTTQDEISDNADEMASKYDDFASNSLFDEIINKPDEGVFDGMKNMLPSGGSCTSYSFDKVSFDFCSLADRLRPILSFVFAFLTLIYLRSVFFNTIKGND